MERVGFILRKRWSHVPAPATSPSSANVAAAAPWNPTPNPSSAFTGLTEPRLNAHPPAVAYSLLRGSVSAASMLRIVARHGTRIAKDLRWLKQRHGSPAATVIAYTHRRDRFLSPRGGGRTVRALRRGLARGPEGHCPSPLSP